jgi:hypothetical protein
MPQRIGFLLSFVIVFSPAIPAKMRSGFASGIAQNRKTEML